MNLRRFPYSLICALIALPSLSLSASSPAAAASAPVGYNVSLAAPGRHLLEVRVTLPDGPDRRDLQLPVWNALYQIRDFAQYVNWVHAADASGKALPVTKLDKSRWQIDGTAHGAVVTYQIYANSPGPFSAQFDSHHAFLNLAEILMYPVDARSAAVRLHFDRVPEGWKIATSLPEVAQTYTARDYDSLVDAPLEISNFHESDFDESGGHYRVIFDADSADYDSDRIVAALRKIVAAATSWMNDRPFSTYLFIYHFPRGSGGGGMEHAYSTAIDLNAEFIHQNADNVAGVTAHEFFHLWNVKRIRPRTLEPPDYTKENYSRALWFSEGVTSTVENFINLRAGLTDEPGFLAHVGEQITELQRRPAHLTQSAEESSLDAWLEGDAYYRQPDRSISYYNKGELLGILLDLAIRDASHGQACLRDVFRRMNADAQRGLAFDDSDGVRQAVEAVAHADLSSFFAHYVAGTSEIPWDDFFRSVGLHVERVSSAVPDSGFLASRSFDGPMSVVAVTAGGEAERAGLAVGDTVIEIQGKPAGQDSHQQLSRLAPGETLTVKVRSRRGAERELKWKVAGRDEVSYEVKNNDSITDAERARRAAWLKGEPETEAASASN
jgi:predicted metalloprotease with PDZ domain